MANEERLINANAIPYEKRTECFGHGEFFEVQKVYKEQIDKMPTVDAVEVVHGYWHIDDCDSGEPDGYAAFIEVHCSQCGYDLGAESGQYGWSYGDPFPLNYCPNCGAKMDGDGNA